MFRAKHQTEEHTEIFRFHNYLRDKMHLKYYVVTNSHCTSDAYDVIRCGKLHCLAVGTGSCSTVVPVSSALRFHYPSCFLKVESAGTTSPGRSLWCDRLWSCHNDWNTFSSHRQWSLYVFPLMLNQSKCDEYVRLLEHVPQTRIQGSARFFEPEQVSCWKAETEYPPGASW